MTTEEHLAALYELFIELAQRVAVLDRASYDRSRFVITPEQTDLAKKGRGLRARLGLK